MLDFSIVFRNNSHFFYRHLSVAICFGCILCKTSGRFFIKSGYRSSADLVINSICCFCFSIVEFSSPARKSILPMGVFLSVSILVLLIRNTVDFSNETISIGDGFPVNKEWSSAKKLFSKIKSVQM